MVAMESSGGLAAASKGTVVVTEGRLQKGRSGGCKGFAVAKGNMGGHKGEQRSVATKEIDAKENSSGCKGSISGHKAKRKLPSI